MTPNITFKLLSLLNEKSYVKKLGLVKANLSDGPCFFQLLKLIKESQFLSELDLSWNGFSSTQMLDLLELLSETRTLNFINLSWNSIMLLEPAEKQLKP
jgi:hypothetical protein